MHEGHHHPGANRLGAVPGAVLGREERALVLLGELLAVIERHAEVGGVRGLLDDREHDVGRRRLGLVLDGTDMAAAIPGEAEILAHLGGVVDLARRDVVTHAIDLVIGEPERVVGGIEIQPDRVAHAMRVDLAVGAVLVHAYDAAEAGLVELVVLGGRVDVVRLAHGDVELVVGADAAGAGRVVEALLVGRDQVALLDDRRHRDVGVLVEELGGRELQHAVLLDRVQHAVAREADPVRVLELQRAGKFLHLGRMARAGAVGQRVDLVLAGADERHHALRPDRDHAGIRHLRIQADLEAGRQLDVREGLLDGGGLLRHPAGSAGCAWRRSSGTPRACSWRWDCCRQRPPRPAPTHRRPNRPPKTRPPTRRRLRLSPPSR